MNTVKKYLNYLLSSFKSGEDRTQKLKRNVAWSFLIKLFSMAIELIKVPILLSYLDTEKYGVWLTIVSIVMWTHHFDLGLGTGLRYKFTEALALNDKVRGKKLISTAYLSMAAIMITAFILLVPFILSGNWNSILNVSSIANNELQKTVLVIFGIFVMQFVFELISTVLKADQRAAISDVFKPIASVVSLIAVLLLGTFSHNSLFLASLSMSLPFMVILLLANIYFFSKNYKDYIPDIKYFDKYYLKDIYSLGVKYFVGQLSMLVVFSSANILLSKLINPSAVTVYNTAWVYFSLVIIFNTVIIVPFFSAITDAYVREDLTWIRNSMKKMNYIAIFFSIGVIIMLLVSGIAFKLWVGDRVHVPIDLSIILTVFSIMAVFSAPYNNFLGGVGKLDVMMIISICKIILFIPVAIALIKLWGSVGLVLTIIFVNTLPNIFFGIKQYRMIINQKATGIWNK